MESLKAEGTNFVKLSDDFASSVARMMDRLHELNAGPPSDGNEKPPPEKSQGEQFLSGLLTFNSKDGAPPWGDDELGENFGVVYEGVRDGMNESMGHLVAKLKEIGRALTSMSKNHAENEDFTDSLMKHQVKNDRAWQDPTVDGTVRTSITQVKH
ncbi:hypothetical protein [Streptomyces sp. NPDC048611]|uniref:hypothetical protein n=1 Tax=unclassified Streptomyces TaxID=2593676 RepID=UPI0034447C6A